MIVASALGVLAVLSIKTHNDDASNGEIAVSSQSNYIHTNQVEDRSPLTAAEGSDLLDPPNSSNLSQVQRVDAVGGENERARAGESPHPMHSPAAEKDQRDVQQTEFAPFSSSRSIQEQCRTHPVPRDVDCKEVSELLEEMSREERDVEWATRTESHIRAVVLARGNGIQIRSLECKESLCAIETVSPGHVGLTILVQSEQELAGVVDDGDYILAWEEDPSYGRVTITQRVFSRRLQ
jgi:hypothetical protein